LWAEMPEWKKRAGRLLIINGEPIENATGRLCDRPDEDGCRVKVKVLTGVTKRKDGTLNLQWTTKTKVLWAPIIKDNPWWADRSKDGQEVVDSRLIDELDDESIMARHRKFSAGDTSAYRPFLDGMALQYEDPKPCIRKVDGEWVQCRYHTGILYVKQVLKYVDDPKVIARLILPMFIRPERRDAPVPNSNWAYNDWWRFRAVVYANIRTMTARGIPLETAQKRAWGRFTGEHPEAKAYGKWLNNKTIPLDMLRELKRDAYMLLKRNGIDVAVPEALRAYRHMITRRNYGFAYNMTTGRCPIVLTYPEDKFACRIIRHTAVNLKLQMPLTDNGGWVRCGDVDMPGFEFNKLPLEERKAKLGCKCEHCYQDKVFHLTGDRFTITSESVLLEDLFEFALPYLIEQLELGQNGITGEDEDLMFQTFRNMTYDVDELPDYNPAYSLLDPNETEEDWEDKAWDNVNHAQIADKIYDDLIIYGKTGPVVTHPYDANKHQKEWTAYIKMRVKENKERNKPAVKALKEFQKIPWPVKEHIALNDAEDRKVVVNQIDMKLDKVFKQRAKEHQEWLDVVKERGDEYAV
jgi:hypothetical protein